VDEKATERAGVRAFENPGSSFGFGETKGYREVSTVFAYFHLNRQSIPKPIFSET